MIRDALFTNWRDGSIVSYRTISGTLVQGLAKVWTRQADGRTFYRVRVDDRSEMWASSGWMLGNGHHERTCGDCQCPFRTNDPTAPTCGTCEASHRPNDPGEQDVYTNLGGPAPRRRRA